MYGRSSTPRESEPPSQQTPRSSKEDRPNIFTQPSIPKQPSQGKLSSKQERSHSDNSKSKDTKKAEKKETVATSNIFNNSSQNKNDCARPASSSGGNLFSKNAVGSTSSNIFGGQTGNNLFGGTNCVNLFAQGNLFNRQQHQANCEVYRTCNLFDRMSRCTCSLSSGNRINNSLYSSSRDNLRNSNVANESNIQINPSSYVALRQPQTYLQLVEQNYQTLKTENNKLKQQLKATKDELSDSMSYVMRLEKQIKELSALNEQLYKEKDAHVCKQAEKKNTGTYNFNKFNESGKPEKKGAAEKEEEPCNKAVSPDTAQTIEEMESQLATMKKREIAMRKKMEMWRKKYMEIEEEKLELEMELSGEFELDDDESYDDILSVSSRGGFKKDKTEKSHISKKK